ncbi:hypothetical protein [Nitrobacter sp.]|uniref:hypothetical protein n=1 Tax=Nitrobacter sp. TaxID=29420 RepID=UPI0029CAC51D|nr:hypothetical protein [Nitrobacter sp.]
MMKLLAGGAAKVLPEITRDIFGLAGAASVSYGAWMIYPPAGFIVGGALMMLGSVLTAMGGKST